MSSQSPIAHAEALEAALRERLHRLPEYRDWVMASNMLDALRGSAVGGNIKRTFDPERPRQQRLKLNRPSQGDAAEQVIREAGRALTTQEVVDGIKSKGAKVGGQDPLINVSSTLSKDDRFISTRWGRSSVWWLRNEPRPPMEDIDDGVLDLGGATGANTPAAD